MSKIPRPSMGPGSNSPVLGNNPYPPSTNSHLSSPIALLARKSSAPTINPGSIYAPTAYNSPTSSPRSVPRRRPPPPFIEGTPTTTNNGFAQTPNGDAGRQTPIQRDRQASAPSSLPNTRYRVPSGSRAPASASPGPRPVRSHPPLEMPPLRGASSRVASPSSSNQPQGSARAPQKKNDAASHYIKRTVQGGGGGRIQSKEEAPLISFDSNYTLTVTLPDGQEQAHHEMRGPRGVGPIPPESSKHQEGVPHTAPSEETPTHISYRLGLISHLGKVLGRNSQEIKQMLDVQGLLFRVDAMHRRSSRLPAELQGTHVARKSSEASDDSYSDYADILKRLSETAIGEGPDRYPALAQTPQNLNASVQSNEVSLADGLRSPGSSSSVDPQFPEQPKILDRRGGEVVPGKAGVFGVRLDEAPIGSWCTSLIGGQRHELPLVVFNSVEEIFHRGMRFHGLFRISGSSDRVSEIYHAYNQPPLYGDDLDLTNEPVSNLTSLVKRYVRDLPHPILDESLFDVFATFCNESTSERDRSNSIASNESRMGMGSDKHVLGAQILIRLLPPLQFSLFVYLLAFLNQLQAYPENGLDADGIASIFGPGMCASRSKGIPGLGPASSAHSDGRLDQSGGSATDRRPEIKALIEQSENILAWLLKRWPAISENLLDPIVDASSIRPDPYEGLGEALSPKRDASFSEDLERGPADSGSQHTEGDGVIVARPPPTTPGLRLPARALHKQQSLPVLSKTSVPESPSVTETEEMGPPLVPVSEETDAAATPRGRAKSKAPGRVSLIRKLSRGRGEQKQRAGVPQTPAKPKRDKRLRRSSSFGSISSLKSLFKWSGGDTGLDESGEMKLGQREMPQPSGEAVSNSARRPVGKAAYEPEAQASAVLGNLHDLLLSKDKQISRDAQEIQRLRDELAKSSSFGIATGTDSQRRLHESSERSGGQGGTASHQSSSGAGNASPSNGNAQMAVVLSELEAARLDGQRKDAHIRNLHGHVKKLEGELEAALTDGESLKNMLDSTRGELDNERSERMKAEEERERDKRKLEEVRGMLLD